MIVCEPEVPAVGLVTHGLDLLGIGQVDGREAGGDLDGAQYTAHEFDAQQYRFCGLCNRCTSGDQASEFRE